jgi:dimethylhistidine N-methyltransferase
MQTADGALAARLRNFRYVCHGQGGGIDAAEVLAGLSARPKALPAKLFYDARGSALFNAICETEAYYPTRTERAIFIDHAPTIAQAVGRDSAIIEFGPGDMSKVRLLLDALHPAMYVGIDVSESELLRAGPALAREYPWLQVVAVCGDFSASDLLGTLVPEDNRWVAFFPGSTIGNLEPAAAGDFLRTLRSTVGDRGAAIVGVDFRKPAPVLDLAYNDPEGHTRAFNLNLLTRLNRELDADFDVKRFRHHAFFNESLSRVEMHLVSAVAQQVSIAGHSFRFEPGESIHTENSYKYAPEDFIALAAQAGFGAHRLFTDERRWFGVFVLSAG